MGTDSTEAHTALIERFYSAFARRDHQTMAACYGQDAEFSDPVFTHLRGSEVGGMWRMLCERGTDLRLAYRDIIANASTGSAHWEAWYTFSATGRPVHNIIDAHFEFAGGLIQRHQDRFGLYRWARQALGLKGLLLGWAPPVQGAIRSQARRALTRFLSP
ncbi:MAG TPA: nuclear transport factor 2 family protein [Gemmatimonadales bacterium]|nr:nuclear transport factor 2 family protein [Gemmatimonadales bacterium]